MESLSGSDANCLTFCPGIPEEQLLKFQSGKHKIVTSPVNMRSALNECDVYACHAGSSVSWSLANAVPVICVPTQLEQRVSSALIAEQGYGITINEHDSSKEMTAKINEVLHDSSYSQHVAALAKKYQSWGESKAIEAVISVCREGPGVSLSKPGLIQSLKKRMFGG